VCHKQQWQLENTRKKQLTTAAILLTQNRTDGLLSNGCQMQADAA